MSKIKHLSSLQNSLIKKVLLLKDKSRERKKAALFVVEGQRELELALKGGYIISTLFFEPSLSLEASLDKYNTVKEVISVSKEVYQKIAYRGTTEGIVALVESKNNTLENLKLKNKTPLILIAEAPEKPGNIGALLRTADAANLDAVLIANPKTDLYNPNIIRSSVGCVFTVPIAMANTSEIISFLNTKKIDIYCAALTASVNYTNVDYTKATAIAVGTEATGLTDTWLNASKKNIIIPMEGEIDSMNVSVSASILIFEAKRQRLTS
ncbi:TrmH family RNA methyltransferase [Maribacter vaceletii]|uniref:TrmH family RNA methyltransferase n=1 Tax=Maribacter vaceletii TaxID=1206816 RepID=A0A495DSX9_9FLAO|nr:RNA methyltransferase [Maribacter vaceletii]RKR07097.1 TrmH family RNA methyltransferase [Maribacter vaceletii]